jgi:hypothetical protein
MGEYFHMVCHTCKVWMSLAPGCKIREIRLNPGQVMLVGLFATDHPGHAIELRGDEYNYLGEYDNMDVVTYDYVTIRCNDDTKRACEIVRKLLDAGGGV